MKCCPHCGHSIVIKKAAKRTNFSCENEQDGMFKITTPWGNTFRASFSMTEKEFLSDKARREKMKARWSPETLEIREKLKDYYIYRYTPQLINR